MSNLKLTGGEEGLVTSPFQGLYYWGFCSEVVVRFWLSEMFKIWWTEYATEPLKLNCIDLPFFSSVSLMIVSNLSSQTFFFHFFKNTYLFTLYPDYWPLPSSPSHNTSPIPPSAPLRGWKSPPRHPLTLAHQVSVGLGTFSTTEGRQSSPVRGNRIYRQVTHSGIAPTQAVGAPTWRLNWSSATYAWGGKSRTSSCILFGCWFWL